MNYYSRLNKIYSSAAFQGLTEKTQILVPKFNGARKPKNRQSHSYEVALCSMALAESMALPGKVIDYKRSLEVVSLLHDLGHPPFGHDGQKLLNKIMKEKGLKEGFDDNSQTLEVIKKHRLELSDYELASIIKYKKKLYPYQKYSRIIKEAILSDKEYFKDVVNFTKEIERPLACNIMDLADEIAYVTSDNEDFYVLRYGDEEFFVNELSSGDYIDEDIHSFLLYVIEAIKKDDKTMIKVAFNKLRYMFCENYYISDNLKIKPKREALIRLKEKMYAFELKHFIHGKDIEASRDVYMDIFRQYIEWVFEGNYPSRTYKKAIKNSKSEVEKLRMIRDMIAETTDLYVLEWFKSQDKD